VAPHHFQLFNLPFMWEPFFDFCRALIYETESWASLPRSSLGHFLNIQVVVLSRAIGLEAMYRRQSLSILMCTQRQIHLFFLNQPHQRNFSVLLASALSMGKALLLVGHDNNIRCHMEDVFARQVILERKMRFRTEVSLFMERLFV
jgi:hypothetical protein